MPKRWLSRTGRHNDRLIISSPQGPVLHDNQTFDFAFTNLRQHQDEPRPSNAPLPRTISDDTRPTTSAGHLERARKHVRIDAHRNRPRSSDSTLSPTTYQRSTRNRSRSEEDFIGVAFGSPGHPPMAFCDENGGRSPRQLENDFGPQGPSLDQRLQPAKWKKLGNLFRTRPGLTKSRSGFLRDDFEKQNDIGPRHHWHRNQAQTNPPARVPPSVRIERAQPEKLHDGSDPKTILDLRPRPVGDYSGTKQYETESSRARDGAALPRLQTDKPGLWNSSDSNSSSSLLARRSKTLQNLQSSTWLRISTDGESEAGDVPRSARRQTTPTMMKPPTIPGLTAQVASSPTAGKYSLFPPTSTVGIDKSPVRGRLERSNTSPARLSPMHDQHFSGPLYSTQQRNGMAKAGNSAAGKQILVSPEEHTASTTRTDREPWSTNHSQKSSASSAPTTEMDEIFFDIRSIRDSRGVEKDDHFVMTRPDSTQVSLARTRSKLTAAGRTDQDSGGVQRSRIAARARDRLQKAELENATVRGRTPEEENQMRCEEAKLQEIEARVQREVQEKRQKLLDKQSKGPQIPTPDVSNGRFSVSTAVFDETIAAVEAMLMPASMRNDGSGGDDQSRDGTKRIPETTRSRQADKLTIEGAPVGHSKQNSMTMKLLPPDPGMPVSVHSHELDDKVTGRSTPSPDQVRVQAEKNLLSANKRERGDSRTPSPLPLKMNTERAATPSSGINSSAVREDLLSPSSINRTVPASSHASFVTRRAASPANVASMASVKPPSSASSAYSQLSPAHEEAKTSVSNRLRLNNRPIEESPTIPQSPGPGKHNPNRATLKEKPPPVPQKDAKFIPISKFAAKSTIAKVEQAGVRPTRMARAATDGALSSPLVSSPLAMAGSQQPRQGIETPSRPVRSDSMPVSTPPLLSHASYRPSPRMTATQVRASPQMTEAITVVQAKPVAEVSIARTVSLARKQSARVTVPGSRLLARRQEEENKARSELKTPTKVADLQPARTATPTGLGLIMDSPSLFQATHRRNESSSSVDRKAALNSNPSTPDYILESPVDKAEREKAQKAAIVEAAKARARARRRAESETREQAAEDKARIEKYRDSQGEEKTRWEIVDNKAMSPLMISGNRGHKPGVSMNVVVESA